MVLRQLGGGADLCLGRITRELYGELLLHLLDLALALADVDRDSDRAAGVVQRALDRLADPEHTVGRELVTEPPIELLDGTDQTEHALLDQVAHREALALVAPRLRDHKPQIRVDHAFLRLEIAPLDPLRELDFLLGGQQWIAPCLGEEEVERVRRGLRRPRRVRRLAAPALALGRAPKLRLLPAVPCPLRAAGRLIPTSRGVGPDIHVSYSQCFATILRLFDTNRIIASGHRGVDRLSASREPARLHIWTLTPCAP